MAKPSDVPASTLRAPSTPAPAPEPVQAVTPTPEPAPAPVVGTPTLPPQVSIETLAAAFAQALGVSNAQLADTLSQLKPKTRITIENRVARNPMNPFNRKRKLAKNYYQNFSLIDVDDITDEEYELLPQLKEGNFIADAKQGYIIEVIDVKRGAHIGMHLRYNNASVDQRMELMTKCPTLVTILTKCIKEAAEQKEERKRRRLEEDE